MKNDKVTFRRIKGRIVPMKMSRQTKKDLITGSSLVAGGAGVALGSEMAAASIIARGAKKSVLHFETAKHFGTVGKAQYALLGRVRPQTLKAGMRSVKKLSQTLKRSMDLGLTVKGVGLNLGLALAGVGVGKLVNPLTKGDEQSAKEQVASTLVGMGIVFGANRVFKGKLARGFANWNWRNPSPSAINNRAVQDALRKK